MFLQQRRLCNSTDTTPRIQSLAAGTLLGCSAWSAGTPALSHQGEACRQQHLPIQTAMTASVCGRGVFFSGSRVLDAALKRANKCEC
jgi:hypothetical protein